MAAPCPVWGCTCQKSAPGWSCAYRWGLEVFLLPVLPNGATRSCGPAEHHGHGRGQGRTRLVPHAQLSAARGRSLPALPFAYLGPCEARAEAQFDPPSFPEVRTAPPRLSNLPGSTLRVVSGRKAPAWLSRRPRVPQAGPPCHRGGRVGGLGDPRPEPWGGGCGVPGVKTQLGLSKAKTPRLGAGHDGAFAPFAAECVLTNAR